MLGGILTPTSGSINVCGYDYSIDKNSAKKKLDIYLEIQSCIIVFLQESY
ncbi:putative aBC-type transport system, ATP-binding protein [[Clostridium] sordellii ATCC 9714]|nr:putative aBC-type transport system, ATP-binding protein [[Clostridium] sordellii ATCC 9714] [Paeniclostridium sordellii ATCC 9714]